jgi:hypothetical protein
MKNTCKLFSIALCLSFIGIGMAKADDTTLASASTTSLLNPTVTELESILNAVHTGAFMTTNGMTLETLTASYQLTGPLYVDYGGALNAGADNGSLFVDLSLCVTNASVKFPLHIGAGGGYWVPTHSWIGGVGLIIFH